MSEPELPLPRLRLVTADERASRTPDPVDDLDLGDFVSVAEREAQANAMFASAVGPAEAGIDPWPKQQGA